MTTKKIRLWDSRFPPDQQPRPVEIEVDETVASAAVRAGVAAAADPADAGALSSGEAVSCASPVEMVIWSGPRRELVRVFLPAAVSAIAIAAGEGALIGSSGGGGDAPVPTAPVAAPTGFPAITVPFNISRAGSGSASTFVTDYDHAAAKPAYSNTIYLSASGTANGAGTVGDPIPLNLSMAVAMANASGVATRILAPGGTYLATATHVRSASPAATYVCAWYNQTPTVDLVIESSDGQPIISSLQHQAQAFVSTADANIWRTTPTNVCNRHVVDKTKLDAAGQFVALDQVRTVADSAAPWPEINAAWDAQVARNTALAAIVGQALADKLSPKNGVAYYNTANRQTFIRTFDSRQPTSSDMIMIRDFTGNAGWTTAAVSARTLWMENVRFFGGRTPFRALAASSIPINIYGKNCHYLYGGAESSVSDGLGCFSIEGGPGDVVHQNSSASYSNSDGWNYHGVSGATSNAQCPHAFEIDCMSISAGWNVGLINNATTIHEATVAVRVNGIYAYNADRTIHDVNRARSWNLGCSLMTRRDGDATEQSSPLAIGHPSDGLATINWVDAVRLYGSPQYLVEVYPGSTLNYANMASTPTSGGLGGTVAAYTP